MTKLSIVFLSVALLAVAAPAIADDTKADCYDDQPWIGYTTTRDVKAFVETTTAGTADITTCEGEHWDGQDSVDDRDSERDSASCTDVGDPSSTAPGALYVTNCQPADPNDGAPGVGAGAVGIRVSLEQDGGTQQVYTAGDIFGVGKAVLYVGHCDGTTTGLEGDASCGGSHELLTGLYLQDNTNQVLGGNTNILATLVSAPGITKGYVAEADCTQETYQEGAESGDRTLCGRDNTAVSVAAILP